MSPINVPPDRALLPSTFLDALARLTLVFDMTSLEVDEGWERIGQLVPVAPAAPDTIAARGPLAVGRGSFVLRQIGQTGADAPASIGFVAPSSLIRGRWQRESTEHHDVTLAMWRRGWSTVCVERVRVDVDDGEVEFAIGWARPTPEVAVESTSALDDAD